MYNLPTYSLGFSYQPFYTKVIVANAALQPGSSCAEIPPASTFPQKKIYKSTDDVIILVTDFIKHDLIPIIFESFSTNLQNLLISDLVQLLFFNLTGLIRWLKFKNIKSSRVFKR